MKQVPLNITNFEIGDIIVRIEPMLPPANFSRSVDDRSFLGKPYKFLGIANACIYLEKQPTTQKKTEKPEETDFSMEMGMFNLTDIFSMFTDSTGPLSLPVDLWSEGWAKYIDPYEIGGALTTREAYDKSIEGKSTKELQKLYDKAIEAEEYLKAERIKRILDSTE